MLLDCAVHGVILDLNRQRFVPMMGILIVKVRNGHSVRVWGAVKILVVDVVLIVILIINYSNVRVGAVV